MAATTPPGAPPPASLAATLRSDPLFLLGVLLIPLENFWFAPSRGWATIAPLAFLAYCLLNLPRLGESLRNLRPVLLAAAAIFGLGSLNFLRYPPDPGILLDVSRALALGLSFLLALDLYFRVRRRDPGPVLRLLTWSYGLSLLVGLLQWAAIAWSWDGVLEFFEQIQKRSTLTRDDPQLRPRVQFTFTEPSFLSMHLFGVMLPLLILFRGRRECRGLWLCLIGIGMTAVLARSSLRLQLDALLIGVLAVLTCFSFRSRRNALLTVAAAVVGVAVLAVGLRDNVRVQRLLESGVYGDESIASRYFRFNASMHGHAEDPLGLVTGHGLSNVWVPFRRGYAAAEAEYRSDYRKEVDALATRNPTALLSMPLRLLNEVGLLGCLALLGLLFRRRHLLLFGVTLYVYLFFDSYAFYTAWLYVFFACSGFDARAGEEKSVPDPR